MPIGLTPFEVEELLQLGRSSASARCSGLKFRRLIEVGRNADGTIMERPTSTGCDADVLVATKRGMSEAAANKPIAEVGDPTEAKHGRHRQSEKAYKRHLERVGGLQGLRVLQAIAAHTPQSYRDNPPPKKPIKPNGESK